MTPRSIRRAAERKAKKTAFKAQRHLSPESFTEASFCDAADCQLDSENVEQTLFAPAPISSAQLAANRSNAQLSTGPTSSIGLSKSTLNAVKTALTGRTVLLPSDEAADYERHVRAWQEDLAPQGARECDLVQSIADTTWRLKRIPCLESAIFAQGHLEFAETFTQHDASLRSSMIEVQTFMKYEKQLRNLQLQESRLVRRREKESAELRQLQQARKAQEQEALETAAQLYLQAKETDRGFEQVVNGFVFSNVQNEQHLSRSRRQNGQRLALEGTSNTAAKAA